MTIFDLEKIDWIDAKVDFYQLIVDGSNQFIEAENKLRKEGGYDSELITLQSRMQEMAELKLLPDTKCRNLSPKKEKVKEYEIKTKNLRVYLFHLEKKGKVVVLLSKKTPKGQKRDIARFRKLKDTFLKSDYAKS